MIDLHCHILSGIDDGPQTLDGSIDMARAAVAAGVTTVVATPHVSWEWPQVSSHLIAAKLVELTAALDAAGVDLALRAGAEVSLTRAVGLPYGELRRLRLGGGPWLLVECPFTPAATGFEEMLTGLTAQGHRIVLAHPEPCTAFQREPDLLRSLVRRGMLCSVTASALSGRFGRTVRSFALWMMREQLVHDVASDAHSMDSRPPGMVEHLRASGLRERAAWLTQAVPEAILAGTPIPDAPRTPPMGLLARLTSR